jgi:hypothetical protein
MQNPFNKTPEQLAVEFRQNIAIEHVYSHFQPNTFCRYMQELEDADHDEILNRAVMDHTSIADTSETEARLFLKTTNFMITRYAVQLFEEQMCSEQKSNEQSKLFISPSAYILAAANTYEQIGILKIRDKQYNNMTNARTVGATNTTTVGAANTTDDVATEYKRMVALRHNEKLEQLVNHSLPAWRTIKEFDIFDQYALLPNSTFWIRPVQYIEAVKFYSALRGLDFDRDLLTRKITKLLDIDSIWTRYKPQRYNLTHTIPRGACSVDQFDEHYALLTVFFDGKLSDLCIPREELNRTLNVGKVIEMSSASRVITNLRR